MSSSADLSDAEDRSTIVSQATELLGRPVDILVNNAAAAIYQPLDRLPAQAQDADLRDQRPRTDGPGAGGAARNDRTGRGLDRQRVECNGPSVGAPVHAGLAGLLPPASTEHRKRRSIG